MVTVTVAEAVFVESALLAAVIVAVPALLGAVNIPPVVMLPEEAFQVTFLFEVVPSTIAVNESLPLTMDEAEAGEIDTELTAGSAGGGAGALVTLITAEADIVESAVLVAVILAVPVVAGAVYAPEAVIVPADAVQVTDWSVVVPWTDAVNCALPLGLKEAEEGETVTELTAGAVEPAAPRRATTNGRCCPSVTRVRLPSTLLALVAANFTVNFLLWPGESVTGRVKPLMLKPAPFTKAWLTAVLLGPTLVTVATCVLLVPTFVCIETLFGATDISGRGSAKPAHPEMQPITRAEQRTMGTNT